MNFCFQSCRKNVCGESPSRCIRAEIKEFNKDKPCPDAHVDEYTFQGKPVFVFYSGTCGADMTSSVLDCECNSLGYLGGFAGNTTINGESFSNAVFVKQH